MIHLDTGNKTSPNSLDLLSCRRDKNFELIGWWGRGGLPVISFDWVVFLRRKPISEGGWGGARLAVQASSRVPSLPYPRRVSSVCPPLLP